MLLVKTGSHFKLPCFTPSPNVYMQEDGKLYKKGFMQREGREGNQSVGSRLGEIPQAKFPLHKF